MLTLSTLVTTTGQLHPACPCPALGSSPARAHTLWSGHPPRGHFLFCYWEKSHQLKSSSFSLARKCMVCVFSVSTPPPRDGHLASGWRPLSDPSRWGDGLLSLLSVPPPACLGARPLHCPQHPPGPPRQWVSGSFPKGSLGKSVAAGLFSKSPFESGFRRAQEGEVCGV